MKADIKLTGPFYVDSTTWKLQVEIIIKGRGTIKKDWSTHTTCGSAQRYLDLFEALEKTNA